MSTKIPQEILDLQIWMKKNRLDEGDISRLMEEAPEVLVRDKWKQSRTSPLYVSGASDDLIEFEGSLHDEAGYRGGDDSHSVLEFSNGVKLRVKYEGVWSIDLFADPNHVAPDFRVFRGQDDDKPRAKPMSDDEARIRKVARAIEYSDVAVLDMDWEWVRILKAEDATHD